MAAAVTIEGGFAEVGAGQWLMGHGQPAAFFGKSVRRRRKGWVVRDRSRLDLVETTGNARLASAPRPFLTHIPCAATISAVSDKVLVAPASARLGDEMIKAVPMSAMRALVVTVFGLPPEDGDDEGSLAALPPEVSAATLPEVAAALPPEVSSPSGGATSTASAGATSAAAAAPTSAAPAAPTSPPKGGPSAWVVMATASRTTRVAVTDGDTLSVRPEAVVAWTGQRPTGFCPKLGIWDILLPRGPKDLLFNFHGPCLVWIEGSSALSSLVARHSSLAAQRRVYGL